MDKKYVNDLGRIPVDSIDPSILNVTRELENTGKFNNMVDFTNISLDFSENEVRVEFKAVHVSIPSASTVGYSCVVFYNK